MSSQKRRQWIHITFGNLCTIIVMTVVLSWYVSNSTNKIKSQNRDAVLESTYNTSAIVTLCFDTIDRRLADYQNYINPNWNNDITWQEQEPVMNVKEAVTFLQRVDSDPKILYQLIDCATLKGFQITNQLDLLLEVDYSNNDFWPISNPCHYFMANTLSTDKIQATSPFTNPVNGTQCMGFYQRVLLFSDDIITNDVTSKQTQVKTPYLLVGLIQLTDLLGNGMPVSDYTDAGSVLIDSSGNYITYSPKFKGANFYEFLIGRFGLDFLQSEELKQSVNKSDTGSFTLSDIHTDDYFFTYNRIPSADNWFFLTSVPSQSLSATGIDFVFTLLILVFVFIEVTLNGVMIIRLNRDLIRNAIELEKERESAEKANNAKTDFLARMSHEIRTPLNAIIGLGKLADDSPRDGRNGDKIHEYLQKQEIASLHLLGIINDVLDMSKIGEGKLEIDNKPFSIHNLVNTISTIYSGNASREGISFTSEIHGDFNNYLIGDELHIKQIVINLISNAIKYNKKGGYVLFSVEKIEEINGSVFCRFSVKDNGIGINSDKTSLIFNAFERDLTFETSQQISGTGLGLAISQQLAALMHSVIKVESVPNEGSTFFFELMLQQADAIPKKKEVEPTVSDNTTYLAGKRFLIVEDNELNRLILSELLEQLKIQVECAENGQIAVEKVESSGENYYDVILMDIRMPVMDGYESTKRIRASTATSYSKTVPIIALSANAFREDEIASISHGMNAHLSKPIDLKVLCKTIIDILTSNTQSNQSK